MKHPYDGKLKLKSSLLHILKSLTKGNLLYRFYKVKQNSYLVKSQILRYNNALECLNFCLNFKNLI